MFSAQWNLKYIKNPKRYIIKAARKNFLLVYYPIKRVHKWDIQLSNGSLTVFHVNNIMKKGA